MAVRILPLILAFILLGAHFLRAGSLWGAVVMALIPLLLLFKSRWSWLVVQICLYLGAALWINTTIAIIQQRIGWGQPWGRVALILGGVTLFTIWAGVLLNSPQVKSRYS